jgi:hypothetical protein
MQTPKEKHELPNSKSQINLWKELTFEFSLPYKITISFVE